MTRLLIAILVVSGAWMIWWAIGSAAHERGLSAWVDARRAEGWAADVGALETQGFPNRFDTTLTDLQLADPATGVAWSAPFVQFLSLAYKPHQVIAVFPERHVFSTPLQTVTIEHNSARGSLFLEPTTALGLDRSSFVIEEARVSSTLNWDMTLTEGRIAAEKLPVADAEYRIGIALNDLRPAAEVKRALDPTGALPDTFDSLALDATVDFTQPWDRFAIEDQRPQIRRIDLTNLAADWGSVTFRAAGQIDVNAEGIPEGQIDLRAVEWRKLVDMAVGGGLVPEALRRPLEGGLELMASLSGRPDTLDAPLTFQRGRMSLGPIPLGRAPRIIIR